MSVSEPRAAGGRKTSPKKIENGVFEVVIFLFRGIIFLCSMQRLFAKRFLKRSTLPV